MTFVLHVAEKSRKRQSDRSHTSGHHQHIASTLLRHGAVLFPRRSCVITAIVPGAPTPYYGSVITLQNITRRETSNNFIRRHHLETKISTNCKYSCTMITCHELRQWPVRGRRKTSANTPDNYLGIQVHRELHYRLQNASKQAVASIQELKSPAPA